MACVSFVQFFLSLKSLPTSVALPFNSGCDVSHDYWSQIFSHTRCFHLNAYLPRQVPRDTWELLTSLLSLATFTATSFCFLTALDEGSHTALPSFIYSTNTYQVPTVYQVLLWVLGIQVKKTKNYVRKEFTFQQGMGARESTADVTHDVLCITFIGERPLNARGLGWTRQLDIWVWSWEEKPGLRI